MPLLLRQSVPAVLVLVFAAFGIPAAFAAPQQDCSTLRLALARAEADVSRMGLDPLLRVDTDGRIATLAAVREALERCERRKAMPASTRPECSTISWALSEVEKQTEALRNDTSVKGPVIGTGLISEIFRQRKQDQAAAEAEVNLLRQADSICRGTNTPSPEPAAPKLDSRFVGTWHCDNCGGGVKDGLDLVLKEDGTGTYDDKRGGPPKSMYETGSYTGKWTSSGDSATLTVTAGPNTARYGTQTYTLKDGKLIWGNYVWTKK